MDNYKEVAEAKDWWYDISDQQTNDLIIKHNIGKPIKDRDMVKLFSIYGVSNCATWQPTMCLRWYETDNYNSVNDEFDKVLQQKWQSSEGQEKWEDIEVYGR